MDAVDLVRAARRPERAVPLCLRADLVAVHEDLTRRLEQAERAGSSSLAGNQEAQDLAERITAIEEQMREATVVFTLRALSRRAWAQLVAAHPPRPDTPADREGYNVETFIDAAVRACLVSPVLDEDDLDRLLDESLSDRQYEQLSAAMWQLNRGDVSVPFSHAASRRRQSSASA